MAHTPAAFRNLHRAARVAARKATSVAGDEGAVGWGGVGTGFSRIAFETEGYSVSVRVEITAHMEREDCNDERHEEPDVDHYTVSLVLLAKSGVDKTGLSGVEETCYSVLECQKLVKEGAAELLARFRKLPGMVARREARVLAKACPARPVQERADMRL